MSSKTSQAVNDQKEARDAFGGDPIDPGDWVLERIAEVVKGGETDELATKWAAAFKAVCPEPNTPKRILLDKIADAVGGKENQEATAWATGEAPVVPKSKLNLDHMV